MKQCMTQTCRMYWLYGSVCGQVKGRHHFWMQVYSDRSVLVSTLPPALLRTHALLPSAEAGAHLGGAPEGRLRWHLMFRPQSSLLSLSLSLSLSFSPLPPLLSPQMRSIASHQSRGFPQWKLLCLPAAPRLSPAMLRLRCKMQLQRGPLV